MLHRMRTRTAPAALLLLAAVLAGCGGDGASVLTAAPAAAVPSASPLESRYADEAARIAAMKAELEAREAELQAGSEALSKPAGECRLRW